MHRLCSPQAALIACRAPRRGPSEPYRGGPAEQPVPGRVGLLGPVTLPIRCVCGRGRSLKSKGASRMRFILRFIATILGIIGFIIGLLVDLGNSAVHDIVRATGGTAGQTHGFIGFFLAVIGLIGAFIAGPCPATAAILMLVAAIGSFFI